MKFNEFIEFIENKYKRKVEKLEEEYDSLGKQYDDLLDQKKRMKPPIFKKKHPSGYIITGIISGLTLLALTMALIKLFPLVPAGMFVIPASFIAAFGIYAGYEITKMSQDEKGQDSIRYTEYQERVENAENTLDMLLEKRRRLRYEIDEARHRLEKIGIQNAKECYTYLIPSSLKGKTITISENILDELLKNTPLNVIIYKYYHDELDTFRKLANYDRVREIVKLGLDAKVDKVKREVEEDLAKQKTFEGTKKRYGDVSNQQEKVNFHQPENAGLNQPKASVQLENPVPYKRQRRTERFQKSYSELEVDTNENSKISHR